MGNLKKIWRKELKDVTFYQVGILATVTWDGKALSVRIELSQNLLKHFTQTPVPKPKSPCEPQFQSFVWFWGPVELNSETSTGREKL